MVNAHEEKKVILISGTSTGFGRVLAIQALERGYLVIATARKVEAIADLKERGAAILPLDVTASTETLTKFAADAYQIYGRIDYLVNNAGFAGIVPFEETTSEQIRRMYNTNVFGAMDLTRVFLPYLRKQGSGTIVTISSISAIASMGGNSFYSSTKAAISSWSDCLKQELEPFGIQVVSIEPSLFKTNVMLSDNLAKPTIPIAESAYKDTVWAAVNAFMANADSIAEDAEKGIKQILDFLADGAAGKFKLPSRLVLGDMGYQYVAPIFEERLATAKKFENYSTGTSFAKVDA